METQLKRGPIFVWLLAILCLGMALEWWIIVWQEHYRWLPIGFARRRWTVWACALTIGAIYASRTGRAARGLGLGLAIVPLLGGFWSFISSIPALTNSGSVLRAYSEYQLSNAFIRGTMYDLGFIGVGAILWFGIPKRLTAWAEQLSSLPGLGHKESRSIHVGWLLFPPLLAVTIVIESLLYSTPSLANGDEASVWDHMTPYHTILLSASAAFTEELAYRVVGMAVFAWIARKLGAAPHVALVIGLWAQALVFGAAHGFYGTWAHVILPTLFGLIAGALLLMYGVWTPIVLHFLFDVFAFGIHTAERFPGFYQGLNWLLIINVAWTVTWAILWLLRWFLRQLRANEAPAE